MSRDNQRAEWRESLDRWVPSHLREGILEYVMRGRPTGGFLEAVISNDLMLAAQRVFPQESVALASIAKWFVMFAPAECYGTPEAYRDWKDRGGWVGMLNEQGR